MSRVNTKVMDALSLAATVYSKATDIGNCEHVAYQVLYTGADPNGTFQILVSNHHDDRKTVLEDIAAFESYAPTGFSITAADGSDASAGFMRLIELAMLGFRWVALRYTRVSGSGTMNAWVNAK